jgi:hypothetical protein
MEQTKEKKIQMYEKKTKKKDQKNEKILEIKQRSSVHVIPSSCQHRFPFYYLLDPYTFV